jgi:hypothetical protein
MSKQWSTPETSKMPKPVAPPGRTPAHAPEHGMDRDALHKQHVKIVQERSGTPTPAAPDAGGGPGTGG